MKYSEYFSPFYIFNSYLLLIYPILRNYGNTFLLNIKDSWGFKRENSIIIIVGVIIILRYLKYYTNFKKLLHEIFFYSKLGISFLILMIDYKLFFWYIFCCLVIWLLFKPPKYNGLSNFIYIPNEQIFNEIILSKKNIYEQLKKDVNINHKKVGKLDNIFFCMFYSNYSDDCIYTEELFSKISIKYKTKVLNFAKIDVDLNENLCSKYKIYLTGYKINLPYCILFVNGEEKERYPGFDKHGNSLKVKYYREKEIVSIFGLDEIYEKTKDF